MDINAILKRYGKYLPVILITLVCVVAGIDLRSGESAEPQQESIVYDTQEIDESVTAAADVAEETSSEGGSSSAEAVTYTFRKDEYLQQHFEKHGDEFDYETSEEYLAGANRVITSPDALYKTEKEDGDGVYYIEETNELVILSTDGYIRTYFRPNDGIDYFNRQ